MKEILLNKRRELKGDINAMAEHLNISKRALIYKLKKYEYKMKILKLFFAL